MKRQKRLGKLEIDLSPPTEAQKRVETDLRAYREVKRQRKAEAASERKSKSEDSGQGATVIPAAQKASNF